MNEELRTSHDIVEYIYNRLNTPPNSDEEPLAYNADEIVDSIQMLNVDSEHCFLLLEGKDDHFFWKRRVNKKRCELIKTNGSRTLKDVAATLDTMENKNTNVLGVIDADLERLKNTPLSERLVYTDQRDLESMLFMSPAFDRLLDQYEDVATHKSFTLKHGGVLKKALEVTAYWGKLHYIHSELDISHKKFPSSRNDGYIDYENLSVNTKQLYQDFQRSHSLTESEFNDKLSNIPELSDEELARGHDLLSIVNGLLLKGENGKSLLDKKRFKDQDLFENLCLLFSENDLHQTTIFQTLQQKANDWHIALFPTDNLSTIRPSRSITRV